MRLTNRDSAFFESYFSVFCQDLNGSHERKAQSKTTRALHRARRTLGRLGPSEPWDEELKDADVEEGADSEALGRVDRGLGLLKLSEGRHPDPGPQWGHQGEEGHKGEGQPTLENRKGKEQPLSV